jgi:hypothetical protein
MLSPTNPCFRVGFEDVPNGSSKRRPYGQGGAHPRCGQRVDGDRAGSGWRRRAGGIRQPGAQPLDTLDLACLECTTRRLGTRNPPLAGTMAINQNRCGEQLFGDGRLAEPGTLNKRRSIDRSREAINVGALVAFSFLPECGWLIGWCRSRCASIRSVLAMAPPVVRAAAAPCTLRPGRVALNLHNSRGGFRHAPPHPRSPRTCLKIPSCSFSERPVGGEGRVPAILGRQPVDNNGCQNVTARTVARVTRLWQGAVFGARCSVLAGRRAADPM